MPVYMLGLLGFGAWGLCGTPIYWQYVAHSEEERGNENMNSIVFGSIRRDGSRSWL